MIPSATARSAILGVPLDPNKQPSGSGLVRAIEQMDARVIANSAGAIIKNSLSNLNAAASPAAGAMAWVIGDATVANNGVYENTGTSGAPTWVRRGDLPYGYIHAINVGAGTANAIEVTTAIPIPSADGAAEILVPIVTDNTSGTVTLSINGETALPVKTASGNDPAIGGVTGFMKVIKLSSTYRMLTDQESAAIVAAAEAAQSGAEDAQAAAEAAAAGIVNAIKGSADIYTADHTVIAGDAGEIVMANKGTAITFPLTAAATLGDGFQCRVVNIGAGTLTIDPDGSETINGAAALTLEQYESATIWIEGGDWYAATGSSNAGGGANSVATRTAMKALPFTAGAVTKLTEAGYEGDFIDDDSDLSSIITPISATTTAVAGGTGNNTAVAHGLKTAEAIITTTTVNGLTADTLYYAIRVDADNFKLATSRTNALAGTAISLSGTTNFTAKVVRDDLEGVYSIPDGFARDGSDGGRRRLFDGQNFDPRWFGAVSDQATNDWAAFFVMLALMPAGGAMRLPMGLCGMSRTLEIDKRVSIKGAGKQSSGFYGLGLSLDQNILDFQGTTGARIQGVTLDGFMLRSDNSLARGMTLTWVNLSAFRDLYFYNLYRGAYGDNAWSNKWDGFSSFGIDTLAETIRFGPECNNNTFTGCQFTGGSGFKATGLMTSLVFVDCDFENITDEDGAGIMLAPTTGNWIAGVKVVGGYWESIKGYAIATFGDDASSVRALSVSGAYFYGGHTSKFGSTSGQAQYGVVLTNVFGWALTENFFQDWETSALYLNITSGYGAAERNTYASTGGFLTGTEDGTETVADNGSV